MLTSSQSYRICQKLSWFVEILDKAINQSVHCKLLFQSPKMNVSVSNSIGVSWGKLSSTSQEYNISQDLYGENLILWKWMWCRIGLCRWPHHPHTFKANSRKNYSIAVWHFLCAIFVSKDRHCSIAGPTSLTVFFSLQKVPLINLHFTSHTCWEIPQIKLQHSWCWGYYA